MKAFQKYFSTYAEKETQLASLLPRGFTGFDYAVVVPLCDELESFPCLVASLERAASRAQCSVLLVSVVNNRESASSSVKENNKKLLSFWRKILEEKETFFAEEGFFGAQTEQLSFLFLDRSTGGRAFKEKEGVGLARKIGCDLACRLSYEGCIRKDPIFTTDGDAELPSDFFFLPEVKNKKFFMVSDFLHQKDKALSPAAKKAITHYEAYLNSYVEGLEFASSPYAFHSIGSCIAFSSEAYVLVRGFPKARLAGEDFYFLGKVAKLAEFVKPLSGPILLSARESERVPFGTGQAVKKLQEEEKAYQPYEKKLFYPLKAYLELAKEVLLEGKKERLSEESEFSSFFKTSRSLDLIQKISEEKTPASRKMKKFHDTFDAFNTLKFIRKIKEVSSF